MDIGYDGSEVQQSIKHTKFGLLREMVDPRFHEPFILKGYRQPNMKAIDCVKALFVYYNNEAFNVWSHFIAFILFSRKFVILFSTELSVQDYYVWPLISYAIGILTFCLMSAIAHTFNSMSPVARNICFFLDYAAIGIYSVAAGQSYYFYTRPQGSWIFTPFTFAVISIFISISSTGICCMTRHNWYTLKYLLRTLSMVLPFLFNSSPYLFRMLLSNTPNDKDYRALPLFLKHVVLYVLAAVANVTKLPERLIPGVFDALGQSHHFLHIFIVLGANLQFEAIKTEMINRKAFLELESIQMASKMAFAVLIISIIINVPTALISSVMGTSKIYQRKKDS